jgi:hypothetical protein
MKTTAYQFGKNSAPRAPRQKYDVKVSDRTFPKNTADEPPAGLIQGQSAGSLPEWRASLALDRLGIKYLYQYDILGGRSTRGGQVIDFFLFTSPKPTPLQIQGDYWHGGSRDYQTRLNIERIKRAMANQINEVVEVWEHELNTLEAAYNILKERLLGQ